MKILNYIQYIIDESCKRMNLINPKKYLKNVNGISTKRQTYCKKNVKKCQTFSSISISGSKGNVNPGVNPGVNPAGFTYVPSWIPAGAANRSVSLPPGRPLASCRRNGLNATR